MSKFTFIVLSLTAAFLVDQSFSQDFTPRVTLYSGTNCAGSFFTITGQYADDLAKIGWDNYANSARLTGVWNFYDLVNYNQGYNALMEYAFGANEFCITFQNLKARVSSARFAGSPNDYRADTLTLYRGTYFQEQEEYFITHSPTVTLQQHSSLIVTGASAWTLYDAPNYGGNAICVYPPDSKYTPALIFDLATIDVPYGKIRSIARGCFTKRIIRASAETRGASVDQTVRSL